MYDLLIRGASMIDGLGNPPVRADVGVRDGRIVDVGPLKAAAKEVIDADGLVLSPGLVDIHTHYDAQITWDPTLSPSSSLGVSTVVMGNCGFGIAPATPPANDILMRNLSVVEGMDLNALRAGIRWDFRTFPEFMENVRQQSPYLNVAVLIGHSTLRTAVMGEAASEVKVPTAAQLHEMRETVRGALRAGAIGLASSFSLNHSGYDGVPMPSTIAEEAELRSLVDVLAEEKRGIFQIASGTRASVDVLESLAKATGRLACMSSATTMYNDAEPAMALRILDECAAVRERGHSVYAQVTCQPLSMDFTPDNCYPFFSHSAFDRVRGISGPELRRVFADASFRERFREDLRSPRPGSLFHGNWASVSVGLAATPAYASLENQSIADIARSRGADPIDTFFDVCLDEDLQTVFIAKLLNADDRGVSPILKHSSGVIGLSDAGAHLSFMCDAGFGLYFLGHWVRERGDFDLVEGIRRLTSHPADLYGIIDRGRIAVGAHADLLLFDPATVGISAPIRVNDLPAGGTRAIREPKGVAGLWVNGTRIFDGQRTLPMAQGPGQLLNCFH
jgi:N-acyl-D-amino-acid deacylase